MVKSRDVHFDSIIIMNKPLSKLPPRPVVFVGSSRESLKVAEALNVLLDRYCEVKIWSQGVFGLSQGTLESLVGALDDFDFAILVLSPDDLVICREQESPAPRDNVLFELGLFMGALGRQRTYILYDRTADIRLPTDLAGVTAATYQPHVNGDLTSALGAAATKIKRQMERCGLRSQKRLAELSQAAEGFDNAASRMNKLVELIARSRKVELDVITTQFGLAIGTENLEMIKRDLRDLEDTLAS